MTQSELAEIYWELLVQFNAFEVRESTYNVDETPYNVDEAVVEIYDIDEPHFSLEVTFVRRGSEWEIIEILVFHKGMRWESFL